jgi:hypothetical protein
VRSLALAFAAQLVFAPAPGAFAQDPGSARPARQGLASLTDAEIAKLRAIIAADPAARRLGATIRANAEKVLADEPHPIERIATEGKLAQDPVKIATQAALADMRKMEALGLAYAVSGEERYVDALGRFLGAWAATNKPCGNPIDETNLERAIVAFDLVRARLADERRQAVARWLRGVAEAEVASRKPDEPKSITNWNSHRLKIVGLIGYALEDGELEKWAQRGFEEQVEANLRASGASLDFEERDALHYHVYDLQPLLRLAIVLARDGRRPYEWRAKSGASLAGGVAFLLPYARGEKTHAEYVHSKDEFDRQRGEAGQKDYAAGRLFEPKEARGVLELAQFFEPDLGALVADLYEKSGSAYPSAQVLLNAAMRP